MTSPVGASRRHVSVFDAEHATGVAFARSLGRAGVPFTVWSYWPRVAARYSRYVDEFRACPDIEDTDAFVDWLTEAMVAGQIDLVAPTSDLVAFAVAESHERLGMTPSGHPSGSRVRDCLFKDWFADRMEACGFPAAPSATPTTVEEALAAADGLGYPVILKPRSHVGVGPRRGDVVGTPARLAETFRPYVLRRGHAAALKHNPDLAFPLVQRYFRRDDVDVVSVSGCINHGAVVSVGHSRKLDEWGRGRGIGTRFESLPEQEFTAAALEAVRGALGAGLFEFEVLVHRPTGERWAIDLNPRAYGQISLEIARGNDLPLDWYEGVTGDVVPRPRSRRRVPTYWQSGVLFYTGLAVALARGPGRVDMARDAFRSLIGPRVGAFHDVRDPAPGLSRAVAALRHPGGLVRPFLSRTIDEEVEAASAASVADGGRPD